MPFILNYGEVKVDTSKAISVDEMITYFVGVLYKVDFTFKLKVVEVCSKVGCFIIVDKFNGKSLTFRFKNHFTIQIYSKLNSVAYFH